MASSTTEISWKYSRFHIGKVSAFQLAIDALSILGLFLALYGLVVPTEGGDTLRYASDAVQHAHNLPGQFWEFGHLLWRPWGYLGFFIAGPAFARWFGDNDVQAVTRFLVVTNFVSCLGTLVCLWLLLRRFTSRNLATLVVLCFCGVNSFIGFASLGSAYMPALFFETLALYLIAASDETRTRRNYLLAGASFAASVLLWFPFVFAVWGVLAFSRMSARSTSSGDRVQCAPSPLPVAASFLVVAAAGFVTGAIGYGVLDGHSALQWVAESGNGWSQSLSAVRALTGIPRSLFDLSSDTVLLKRWFFHDPYNPVSLSRLAGTLILKLLLFYAGIGGLLWTLAANRATRQMLATLAAASLPLLFFAVFIFEPSSTSRYIPLLPFLYLSAALGLQYGSRTVAYWATCVLLLSALILNAFNLSSGQSALAQEVGRQKQLLTRVLTKPAVVYVSTLHEPFDFVALVHPLDHRFLSSEVEVRDVIEVASHRVLTWKSDFAEGALQAWRSGLQVWLSRDLLAPTPAANSWWVEGDDRRIGWREVNAFFSSLETEAVPNGPAELVRLPETKANQDQLRRQTTRR